MRLVGRPWAGGRDVEVVVYTRAGCGLCARAEELVRREAGARASIAYVDVDGDESLIRRYGVRVPVVEVDGVEVAELQVEAGVVRRAVRAVRRAR